MKYIEIINKATRILKKKKLEENLAYKLLFYVDKKINSIIEFTSYRNEEISFIKIIRYKFLLYQYVYFKKPLSYITKNSFFYGNDFIVFKSMHTPRIESEILIDKANELINKNKFANMLDLCCGTGNLGISVLLHNSNINLSLSDVSKKSIKNTLANIQKYNLKANIIHSNLFNNIKEKYDLIICNPPYIKKGDKNLDWSVKMYESKKALYAKDNGLFFYKKIIKNINNFLNENGVLIFEIGFKQAEDVISILKLNNSVKNYEILKDQFFNDRAIVVYF